jgi:ABC-type Zn uptake system ZnuABC Zn-binding protein ZnuA
MNKDHIEIANYVQEFPPQEKILIYNVYKEFLPKNNKWNKYIKSKSKSYNKELLLNLSDHWKCSQREVKDYISMLDNEDIISILSDRGMNKKEIKTLLK